MFLFLLLAFMVIWALSLVGLTQLAWPQDRESRAKNLGPYATGARSGWLECLFRVFERAKAAGYCPGLPRTAQDATGLDIQAWPLGAQELNAKLMRRGVPASWSKRLSRAEAWLLAPSPKHVIRLISLAQGARQTACEVGTWLPSLAR